MNSKDYSPIKNDDVSNVEENTYCIVLNIAEGIGFDLKNLVKSCIVLKVSLNGEKFDVEGHFSQSNVVTFSSNCIWECELEDVKRIKTENRPVKLECFLYNKSYASGFTTHLGSLLLTLQRVRIINNLKNFQIKPNWYKLSNLSSSCRQSSSTPQLYLTLMIVKKPLVDLINYEAILDNHKPFINASNRTTLSSNVTHTQSMLQSQHGLFVKLLENVGQIQVGNNPLEDCDIFLVTLTFRQIKNILSLLNIRQRSTEINKKYFIFQYDILGSILNKEILIKLNDCFAINQKMSLYFRSSVKSLRQYFQQIFYIPISLNYASEIGIATCNFDISSFLPDDVLYFNEKERNLWTKYGSFHFDIPENLAPSPSTLPPLMEFKLTLELLQGNVEEKSCDDINGERHLSYSDKHGEVAISQEMPIEVESLAVKKCKTNHLTNKSVCSVAVNTDDSQFEGRTKEIYMQELNALWEDQKTVLMATLEAKFTKCDQLLIQFENTQIQFNDIAAKSLEHTSKAGKILQEFESTYKLKIDQLEMEIKCLKIKVQEKETEKTVLAKRTYYLEKQLEIHQKTHLSLDQLKDVLNEMRIQADRFAAIENFYKERCSNDMLKLKENILKADKRATSKSFCLEEIFSPQTTKSSSNRSTLHSSVDFLNLSFSGDE